MSAASDAVPAADGIPPAAGPEDGVRTTATVIRPFGAADARAVQQLVLGIQRDEFGIPITLEEQPDLVDVPGYYRQGKGGFWVAVSPTGLVGTIGLLDIGHRHGALRKMFVAPSHRGAATGVGSALLQTCLQWAAAVGMSEIMLGTTEQLRAAHRFYEKWGFSEISADALPPHFPRMRLDTKFYRYRLAE